MELVMIFYKAGACTIPVKQNYAVLENPHFLAQII